MPDPAAAIRSYGLFGESAQLPDVMHCETIAARSVLHDWELAPHRHARLHQLLLLRRGGGTLLLEGRRLVLRPLSLVNVAPGDVHGYSFDPGTQGWVATLADAMLDEMLVRVGDVRRQLERSAVVAADASIGRVMAHIEREFTGREPARALVLRGLCATLLGLAARALARDEDALGGDAPSVLLQRFEAMVEVHYLEHWAVADYARALAVTPTHLSRVARAETGAPASQLIAERLMREARRQLTYTHLHVKSIAYALGFADPAHFSRAFARAAGVAPGAFRRHLADSVTRERAVGAPGNDTHQ